MNVKPSLHDGHHYTASSVCYLPQFYNFVFFLGTLTCALSWVSAFLAGVTPTWSFPGNNRSWQWGSW